VAFKGKGSLVQVQWLAFSYTAHYGAKIIDLSPKKGTIFSINPELSGDYRDPMPLT